MIIVLLKRCVDDMLKLYRLFYAANVTCVCNHCVNYLRILVYSKFQYVID